MEERYRIFNKASYPGMSPDPMAPTIRFSIGANGAGLVRLNKKTAKVVGVQAGDRVELVQDRTDPYRIGIRKTDSPNGFRLRQRESSLAFSASVVTRRILLQFGHPAGTTVQIGTEPSDGIYWILRSSIDRRG